MAVTVTVDTRNWGCVDVGDSATVGRTLDGELEAGKLLLGRLGSNGMMAGGFDSGSDLVG